MWHRYPDEEPQDNVWYIVALGSKYRIALLKYSSHWNQWLDGQGNSYTGITYWMPITDLPRLPE